MVPRPLVRWIDEPSADRGIHFAEPDERWDFWSYSRLAQLSRAAARGLMAAGVGRNEIVILVQRSTPQFVATFFGAILAGAIPSVLAPPTVLNAIDDYSDYLRGIVTACRPAAIVVEAAFAVEVEAIAAPLGVRVLNAAEVTTVHDGRVELPHGGLSSIALLQFTSGSTGRSRGVGVPFEALETNALAIRTWLQIGPTDAWGSWLPMYHDMGLVGSFITSIIGGTDIWLLQPDQFIRRPMRYLACFGSGQATITATPNFGLDYILRRVRPDMLKGLDFSGWRKVVIGAERIDPRTLDRFWQLLSPFGMERRFLLPAYGLAEATLAVTGVPVGEEWHGLHLEPASLSLGAAITPCGAEGQAIVGCGRPLNRVSVTIVGEDGRELPDGCVGEIVIRGASVAAGYLVDSGLHTQTTFDEGALHSGDAGFVIDGQLFVIGRLGDSIKIRGRAIFAEDLEAELYHLDLPPGRLAVLLGVHEGSPTVVALFEQATFEYLKTAEAILRRRTEGARLVLINSAKGAIARTSSGKPRRRPLWRAFIAKTIPGTEHTSSGDEQPTARLAGAEIAD